MNAVAQIFAIVAGLVYAWAWAMESLLWRRPAVQRIMVGHEEPSPSVRLWAFNQGFYNLCFAAGAIGAVIAYRAGYAIEGRTLGLYTTACMAALGPVLFISDRTLWRGAIGQTAAPLVAFLALVI